MSHSNLKETRLQEIRLDRHSTVSAIKSKLVSHVGTNPSAMRLELRNESGAPVASMEGDENRKLGYWSPQDGWIIHVVDTDPGSLSANGWLEDVSKVEKFVLSDEAYDARENTYRKFKESKLKDDPTWTLEKELAMRKGTWVPPKPKVDDPDFGKSDAEVRGIVNAFANAPAGAPPRCSCEPGDRRGVVLHVGPVEGLPAGWWIGVKYDEPLGRNDGSVKGVRIFECPPSYGGFLRPDKVQVGEQFTPIDDLEGSDFSSGPDEI